MYAFLEKEIIMEKIKEGYTRISEILSQWDKYGMVAADILEHKKDVGSYVHSAIHTHISTGMSLPLDRESEGYYQSYLKWQEESHPKFLVSERRFYNDSLMITGGIDAIATISGEQKPMIIDWKTSSSEMQCDWRLQGAFYWMLAHDSLEFDISEKIMFLRLNRYGELPKVHMYEFNKEIGQVCIAALTTFRYREKFSK
jgi:hypothetical protein